MNVPLWFSNLAFWCAQVAVLTLAAGILVRILRIREPKVLLVCWRTLLGASLLLPFIEPWKRPEALLGAAQSAPEVPLTPTPAISVASATVSHWHFAEWAAIAEILGAVLVAGIIARLAMLLVGLPKLRQLRRESVPIPADAECAPILEETQKLASVRAELRLSREVESPVTFGFARPVVLLPEKFLQLDELFQAAIVCHELVHVRRRDWAHHLGEEVLRAVLWFHPAILWLVARVRLAREQVVDLKVVRLTSARKTYVEALMEFTSARRVAAIPAPPLLAEQQFVERIALMLKEARMSRIRLFVSLSAIVCALALAAVFAVSVFPLKAAPRAIAEGQEAQAAQGFVVIPSPTDPSMPGMQPNAAKPVIAANTIQVETVKKGDMVFTVAGDGTLIPANRSGNLIAEVLVGYMAHEVRLDQSAVIDTHKGLVNAHVSGVGLADSNGNRWFDVAPDSPLPSGIGANASVEAFINVGKLENVLYISHPHGPGTTNPHDGWGMFKVTGDGRAAVRVEVEFGRSNLNQLQIEYGLHEGDKVIVSDMFPYERFDRLQITH